jgi:ketosteroid isomerase-like protein
MKGLANLVLLIVALPLALAVFGQQPQPIAQKASNTEADVKAIKEWIGRYCAAVTAGDFKTYRDFWTEDVVWLPPNGPTVKGIEACMEHNRPYFEDYESVETMSVEEIEIGNPVSFVHVNYTCVGKPKAEGEPFKEDGKGIFLLKRRPDGSWVSTHCVWNSNIPLSE